MDYDVYYTTGGGTLVQGGADVWVNDFITDIVPKLHVQPKLMIHRNRPVKEWKENEHKNFTENVKKDIIPPARKLQTKMVDNFKKVTGEKPTSTFTKPDDYIPPKKDLSVYWQGDSVEDFKELMENSRRINILHGYYRPHKIITDNKHKIHTNAVHCDVNKSVGASLFLGLEKHFHFHMEPKWEQEVVEMAKHPFWIGVDKPTLKNQPDKILHIPNYYEFKHNLDVIDNNRIGFHSRMETRKCPHFLHGLRADVFTSLPDIKWWERNLNLDTSKWRKQIFRYENLNRFYQRNWGISHSAHIVEPFGYSIFQAIDFGKVPILAEDWHKEVKWPWRASSPQKFKEQYENICEVSLDGRRNELFRLREYLSKKFDNKEEWVESLLKLYNE